MRNSLKERERKRLEMKRRSAIIARVENELNSTNLDDDKLFLAICKALKKAGLELHDDDQARYDSLKGVKKTSEEAMTFAS